MILDPFSAALHTIRDLRDAANAPALARSRRATLMLADHTEHVVDLLQKVDNAHSDDRVSTDIAVRLDRMEANLIDLSKLLRRLRDGTTLRGLLWRDEIKARIEVAYTTLTDAIDKLDPEVRHNLAEHFQQQAKRASKEDAKTFIENIQGALTHDKLAIEFLQIRVEQMKDAMLSMQKRLARLADPRVSQLFANAIRGCETVLDVPPLMHNPDDSVLSALEIVLHEDEVYGARGRVYGGDLLGIRIAIRLLPVGFPNRVLEEAVQTWKLLKHRNVLAFVGAGTLSDPPFIAYELAVNGPVLSYLNANPSADRLQLVLDVATGLAYLHSERVPHGDLRAANILVLGHGQACLADYAAGVLKAAGPAPREEVKQGPDGTRRPRPTRWMSPEVMRGQPWDAKADVYSLGMTVYEIFTGQYPLVDALRSELFALVHRGERPTRPQSGPLATIDPLWQLVASCWAHQPGDRPSAGHVATILKAIAEGQKQNRKGSTDESVGQARNLSTGSVTGTGNGRTLPVPPSAGSVKKLQPRRVSKLPEWTPPSTIRRQSQSPTQIQPMHWAPPGTPLSPEGPPPASSSQQTVPSLGLFSSSPPLAQSSPLPPLPSPLSSAPPPSARTPPPITGPPAIAVSDSLGDRSAQSDILHRRRPSDLELIYPNVPKPRHPSPPRPLPFRRPETEHSRRSSTLSEGEITIEEVDTSNERIRVVLDSSAVGGSSTTPGNRRVSQLESPLPRGSIELSPNHHLDPGRPSLRAAVSQPSLRREDAANPANPHSPSRSPEPPSMPHSASHQSRIAQGTRPNSSNSSAYSSQSMRTSLEPQSYSHRQPHRPHPVYPPHLAAASSRGSMSSESDISSLGVPGSGASGTHQKRGLLAKLRHQFSRGDVKKDAVAAAAASAGGMAAMPAGPKVEERYLM